ncbi:S9 family peptidase [uncultured Bacteroides sp.]|uniref:S9 family peptidase n=1 Tax=uncultured Bacteroides sp. TaxID=162156 RepID=UPI0025D96CD0|nr:S9 family peptidase [uncultured Bacteroides sp.]
MKSVNLLLMSAAMTFASCGGTKDAGQAGTPLIERSDIQIEGKRMTPEALWAMGRIGGVAVSPDEKQIAYTVSYYSVEQNKSNSEIFLMNADGTDNRQLTYTTFREGEISWIKGGTKLAFLSSESGSSQIWEMNPDGSGRRQLTQYDGDIEGYAFSPDGKKLLFIAQVKTKQSTADKHPDLPQATGIIVDDLMYKHWDEWVTTAPHPFIADFDGNAISNTKDILEGLPYESPMKPFGGIEQLAWSPASDKVAFTCRMKTGLAYAISTDSDIYEYDLLRGGFINLCKRDVKTQTEAAAQNGDGVQPNSIDEFMGYDTNPQYSPDGKYIAWQSMERDGYEADLNRLCVMNRTTGEKRFVVDARNFPSNVDAFLWNKDSQGIYFLGVWHGETHIYHADITKEEPTVRPLTQGMYDYASIALCGNSLIAKRHSMSAADEIFAVQADSEQPAPARQLTTENQHIYDQLEMGKVEPRWMETTDGKQMLTWVIYPPQFDPNKKYPTLLFCEGGPQSPVSQFWSYRWNFQIMAANGYIIVAPNRRGLPGFGVEWNEAISGDYGGQCMKDYFTAIDAMAKEPFVDADRLGCVGASFGGFSVYWLAGHHDKRFKAFIAHDGIFNMEMQYLETEEKWFANWDMGGAYWEKDNATAQRTFANSPHKFVDKWDTPILCIHGEKDYRILPNQAMAAFDAAVMRGVPAQLLIYPDENHWVLKPQNGVLWQRTFFEWLDRWLKK